MDFIESWWRMVEEGQIGQMALVGDVWYQIMDKRHGVNELSGYEGNEYFLYSKSSWIPQTWIKDVKDKSDVLFR